MKLISLTLLSLLVLFGCSQKKETFSLICDTTRLLAIEGEAPRKMQIEGNTYDFIENTHSINKNACPVWTADLIECGYSDQDSSTKFSYNRKTGQLTSAQDSLNFMDKRKQHIEDSSVCKVIPGRSQAEMMYPSGKEVGAPTLAELEEADKLAKSALQAPYQKQLIETVLDIAKQYRSRGSDFGTREYESKDKAWMNRRDAFGASIKGKKIDGWVCTTVWVLEKSQLTSYKKDFMCYMNEDKRTVGSIGDEALFVNIKPTTKILFDKAYKGDQLRISGTIVEGGSLGNSGAVDVRFEVDADSIEQISK